MIVARGWLSAEQQYPRCPLEDGPMFRRLPYLFCAVVAAVLCEPITAGAQSQKNTIDHPVTIYVAGTAGGGIDLFGRAVGRHLGRHIPGNPTVTVQVMPGAGGIRAANFLAQQAPKDGTAITT